MIYYYNTNRAERKLTIKTIYCSIKPKLLITKVLKTKNDNKYITIYTYVTKKSFNQILFWYTDDTLIVTDKIHQIKTMRVILFALPINNNYLCGYIFIVII